MIGKIEDIAIYLFKLDRDKEYQIEIKEYKPKRSLDSNSYCWVLCQKIANVMRLSKEEVYQRMLKEYGQFVIIKIRSDIMPQTYFEYYEEVNQKEGYTYYKIFKGSSEMDSKEMSILIDGIVQEAQELDIDTLTPSQIADLKSQWNKEG